MQGTCLYTLYEKEVAQHIQGYEHLETVQKLKMWLQDSLHTDFGGWVPNEVWDAAKEAHRTAYNEWIESAWKAEANGEGLTVEEADRLWPFNSRR